MPYRDLNTPAPSFKLCKNGKNCAPLPKAKLHSPKGFNYTSPSHRPNRSKKEKLDHGCIQKDNRFTGNVCLEKDAKGQCIMEAADSYCMTNTPPCAAEKERCPVQLVFIEGKPNLRFCVTPGKPGYVVPFSSPTDAQKEAEKACKDWKTRRVSHPTKEGKTKPRWPRSFFPRKYPKVVEDARSAHPEKGLWGKPGLGETPPKAPFNPVPALFGAGVAVFLLSQLKK